MALTASCKTVRFHSDQVIGETSRLVAIPWHMCVEQTHYTGLERWARVSAPGWGDRYPKPPISTP